MITVESLPNTPVLVCRSCGNGNADKIRITQDFRENAMQKVEMQGGHHVTLIICTACKAELIDELRGTIKIG